MRPASLGMFVLMLSAACSPPPPTPDVSVTEARQYSTHPEEFARRQRFGTDWIDTMQGRIDRPLRVDPGDPNEAAPYYREIEQELGAPFPTLNAVITFMGYPGVTGKDLEVLDPSTLMDPALLTAAVRRTPFQDSVRRNPLGADDVLVTRFFAPKITDVSIKPGESPLLGWRKIVRLKALEGSPAKSKGVATGWFLFNVFSNKLNPFEAKSLNNQVMLIRGDGTALSKPAYWLVFGAANDDTGDADRIDALNASFDNRAGGNKNYYVPRACAHCHGGLVGGQPDYGKAKLNYLDSDHWFDRIKDDFPLQPDQGVVFDGGTVVDSDKFRKAFAAIYALNREIKAQNTSVDPGEQTFQSRAVSTWLALHESNPGFVDMFDRNIAPAGKPQWTKTNAIDRQVLPLLNRYCFRCHSSIEYHIFDKEMVIDRGDIMASRLNLPVSNDKAMPQDRDLTQGAANADRQCLMRLLPRVGEDAAVSCTP